uniref:Putative secreted protein n=1 Tax=Ixodes ricinus TaxID=34613 RepID=A0A6B0U4A4_IXORI
MPFHPAIGTISIVLTTQTAAGAFTIQNNKFCTLTVHCGGTVGARDKQLIEKLSQGGAAPPPATVLDMRSQWIVHIAGDCMYAVYT